MIELWHPAYALNATLRGLSRLRLGIDDFIGRDICRNVELSIDEILSEEMAIAFGDIADTIQSRDRDLGGHGLRVGNWASRIARELGKYDSAGLLLRCGQVHDIGKIGVEEAVLLKPGRLDEEEFVKVREHVKVGYALLVKYPSLKREAAIIYNHHEQWSGRGYPQGLAGVQIPLEARILSVADTFDAIISERPGRIGRSTAEAKIEMKKAVNKGQLWEPAVLALERYIDSQSLKKAL